MLTTSPKSLIVAVIASLRDLDEAAKFPAHLVAGAHGLGW